MGWHFGRPCPGRISGMLARWPLFFADSTARPIFFTSRFRLSAPVAPFRGRVERSLIDREYRIGGRFGTAPEDASCVVLN